MSGLSRRAKFASPLLSNAKQLLIILHPSARPAKRGGSARGARGRDARGRGSGARRADHRPRRSHEGAPRAKQKEQRELPGLVAPWACRWTKCTHLHRLQDLQREIVRDVTKAEDKVVDARDAVQTEKTKLGATGNKDREPLLAEIAKLEAEQPSAALDVARGRQDASNAADEQNRVANDLDQVKSDITRTQRRIGGLEERVQGLHRARTNALHNFGAGTDQLVKLVNSQRWTGRKPVGPIGAHVKVKVPMYSPVLETVFGQTLNAFVADNVQDANTLRGLLKRVGGYVPVLNKVCSLLTTSKHRRMIPIGRWATEDPKQFDVRGSEPPEHVLTMLRALEVRTD